MNRKKGSTLAEGSTQGAISPWKGSRVKRQDPDILLVRKQCDAIKLWGIGEEIGQAIRTTKKAERGKDPAARGVVTGEFN